METKHIFFDIDGTLCSDNVSENEGISNATLETLQKMRENGHKLYLATGRSHSQLTKSLKEFNFDGFILSDGGIINVGDKSFSDGGIAENEVKRVVEEARKRGITTRLITPTEMIIDNINEELLKKNNELVKITSGTADIIIKELTDFSNVIKFHMMTDRKHKIEELDFLLGNYVISTFEGIFFDVRPNNISKAKGLQKIIDVLNINIEDTIAIGDGDNDIELFEVVGLSICMDNGTDKAKASANMIADHIDNDGLPKVFKELKLA